MRIRRALGGLAAVLLVLASGSADAGGTQPDSPGAVATAVVYSAPVALRVLRGFEAPAGPYGPGHRGVDLAAAAGAVVHAAGDGRVAFAGSVAGRGVLVIAHADGVRTEYEPVRASVRMGAVVRGSQVVGVVSGRHPSCAPASCLHWGARRGEVYLDPLLLLRRLGPVRLLPWHG